MKNRISLASLLTVAKWPSLSLSLSMALLGLSACGQKYSIDAGGGIRKVGTDAGDCRLQDIQANLNKLY